MGGHGTLVRIYTKPVASLSILDPGRLRICKGLSSHGTTNTMGGGEGSNVDHDREERKSSEAWDADISLAQRICGGDDVALRELFERYVDRLYSFIYYRVGESTQDAEDILQDTLMTAVTRLKSFQGQSRLYTWLCGIAWHKVEDFYRRQQRLEKTMIKAVGSHKVRLGCAQAANPADPFIETLATQQWVHSCLGKLPTHYQAALVLKYARGFSVAEIAQTMDKSPKAVESLLTRARKAFRTVAENDGDGWTTE